MCVATFAKISATTASTRANLFILEDKNLSQKLASNIIKFVKRRIFQNQTDILMRNVSMFQTDKSKVDHSSGYHNIPITIYVHMMVDVLWTIAIELKSVSSIINISNSFNATRLQYLHQIECTRSAVEEKPSNILVNSWRTSY